MWGPTSENLRVSSTFDPLHLMTPERLWPVARWILGNSANNHCFWFHDVYNAFLLNVPSVSCFHGCRVYSAPVLGATKGGIVIFIRDTLQCLARDLPIARRVLRRVRSILFTVIPLRGDLHLALSTPGVHAQVEYQPEPSDAQPVCGTITLSVRKTVVVILFDRDGRVRDADLTHSADRFVASRIRRALRHVA